MWLSNHRLPGIGLGVIAVAAVLVGFNPAVADAEWKGGGDGLWSVPGHWRSGELPGAETIAIRAGMGEGGRAVLESPHNSADDATKLRVGWGNGKPGELLIREGGELHVNSGSFVGEQAQGLVVQDGGLLRIGFGAFYIGNKAGGDGKYRLLGGTLNADRADSHGVSLVIGSEGAKGILHVAGGNLLTRGVVRVGRQGTLRIDGEKSMGVVLGDASRSVGADLIVEGRLELVVDARGIAAIRISQGSDGVGELQGSGNLIFKPGSVMALEVADDAAALGSWLALRWDGDLQDGGVKVEASAGLSYAFEDLDGDGRPDALVVTRGSAAAGGEIEPQ